jgi:hypothetical protein
MANALYQTGAGNRGFIPDPRDEKGAATDFSAQRPPPQRTPSFFPRPAENLDLAPFNAKTVRCNRSRAEALGRTGLFGGSKIFLGIIGPPAHLVC